MQLTPMELIIYNATEDGKPHPAEELIRLIDGDPKEETDRLRLRQIVFRVRQKLPELGQEIIGYRYNNSLRYIRVRLLESCLATGTGY